MSLSQQQIDQLIQNLYGNDNEIKTQTLKEMDAIITTHWAEISEELPKLIELSETIEGIGKQYAYLVISKSYFYIESYDEAVNYALKADELFKFEGNDNYSVKMITHLIDMYIKERRQKKEVDQLMEDKMNKFFKEAIEKEEEYLTIGIALDCRRVDVIKEILGKTKEKDEIIEYLKKITNSSSVDYSLKNEVMEIVSESLNEHSQIDLESISECWVKKNDGDGFMKMFNQLSEEMKMQVLLDYEGIPQKFREELISKLPEKYHKYIDGKIQEKLYLDFLFSRDKTDNLLLNNIKSSNCIKSSVIQTAVLYANAFMHYGTTNIMFLKDNNDWIINASNWGKFATTASLGVLFKGRENEALNLMSPYTANGTGGKSVYAQSGRLYALGLIFGGHGKEILTTITDDLKQSKSSKNEVLQHGACLGVGLAGIATENYELYQEVKEILINNDSAVAGMTAGLSLGLIMMGSGNLEVAQEMLTHCHETEHDKIIRGTSVGIGLVMFGMQDKADGIIDLMVNDANHVLRYGGIYTIGLAYCGTANEKAISKLLHFAVTDRSDEVKRAAVLVLGFILNKRLDELCKTILLLIDSYNPHVRYGAALALGIAGCASNDSTVIGLLEPLLKDPNDFVKQGAAIALGMVLMETSIKENDKVEKFIKDLQNKISFKGEGMLTQFGSILGLGIVNAGGRNCTISMYNNLGTFNLKAVAGLVLFNQYWYWYPFTLCLSLSFIPTTIIGVTEDLKYVESYQYISNAPSDQFDYLPMTKPPTKTGHTKMNQTKLSYGNKQAGQSLNLSSSLLISEKITNEIIPEEKKMEEEPIQIQPFVTLQNGSRVTPRQLEFITEIKGSRFVGVKKPGRGILILKDTQPQMEEENSGVIKDQGIEMTEEHKALADALLSNNNDPKPPEPFEWNF
ncbi:hypothetical protein ENUP19_0060G0027 [Entamoeba nuttalli]|uniref:Proteasome/cyclosome repeat-containing protein n=1 Tax=Entamoeba nuttalli TaxID=412467 RepID=A0ABQ0DDP7_9EUKA